MQAAVTAETSRVVVSHGHNGFVPFFGHSDVNRAFAAADHYACVLDRTIGIQQDCTGNVMPGQRFQPARTERSHIIVQQDDERMPGVSDSGVDHRREVELTGNMYLSSHLRIVRDDNVLSIGRISMDLDRTNATVQQCRRA